MLLVVSHLGAPPSGQIRCQANYTAGGSEALSPTISEVILQILINIISLEPGRFSVQKAIKNE